MINKQKLKEIMQFVIKEYPNGCANRNWRNSHYINIVEDKEAIEDWDVENIVEKCVEEFTYEDLDLCGCGSPEDTREVVRLILTAQNQDEWDDKQRILDDICGLDNQENSNYYGLIQFILYVLDSHGFLEHGSSIGGAWLSKKGKLFLELLNMNYEINKED